MAPAGDGPSGVLLLDKAAGPSSTQALAAAKRLLRSRKAGHTGTLDPFATGLLPLAFGEATKFSRFLLDAWKGYEATLRLGYTSTTLDPEGDVTATGRHIPGISRITEVLGSFMGVRHQIPPMHSAIHHEGKRLYDLARAGIEVERAPREVTFRTLDLLQLEGDLLRIAVICSKGTYIRTLAADLGEALGCGAYLVALRRTQSGPFSIHEAITLETLAGRGLAAIESLMPVESLVSGLPECVVVASEALRVGHGMTVPAPAGTPSGDLAVRDPAGRFLGVSQHAGDGWLKPLRLLAEPPHGPDFA